MLRDLTRNLSLECTLRDQNNILVLGSMSILNVSQSSYSDKHICVPLYHDGDADIVSASFCETVCLLLFSYELHRQLRLTDDLHHVSVVYAR